MKERNPDICGVLMQPDSPFHGLEGLRHIRTAYFDEDQKTAALAEMNGHIAKPLDVNNLFAALSNVLLEKDSMNEALRPEKE